MAPSVGPSLRQLVEERRILVCCGSGGVGKTTAAAVLALEAARAGRRAVVVTIDPAKRLADALVGAGSRFMRRREPNALLGGLHVGRAGTARV